MASFNVTAEDSSPLITWGPPGAWNDSPDGDFASQSYSAQSWHKTSSQGAYATISFEGTGIWLYGAKRPDYGQYNFAVDGQSIQGSAKSETPAFQQLLGGKSGLPMGLHTVTLTNTGSGSSIDLDSFVFETQIGSTGAKMSKSTTDDSSPEITYTPSSSDWSSSPSTSNMNNTLHYTQTGGAQALFKFSGDAVAVYGTVSSDHANYTISVDGKSRSLNGGADGIARTLHYQTLLYFANNLGSGDHNFVLTANPDQAGQQNTGKFMDIDSIDVYTTSGGSLGSNNNSNQNGKSPSNGTPSSGNPPGPPNAMPGSGLSTGLIAAIVAVLIGVLLVLLFVFLFFRRKHIQRKRSRMPLQSPTTPTLPIQDPDYLEAGFAGIKGPPSENPFADPEKPVFDASTGYLSRSTSVRSYAHLDMPQTPRTGHLRDSYYGGQLDGEGDDLQVRSNKWSNIPLRPPRPPTLRLPGAR